ncbi:MAG TPA: hypothetical protein VHP14_19605 [Anaerolineales bacterium]|nr:hypothetical protein [Anaerolineales bacterium]
MTTSEQYKIAFDSIFLGVFQSLFGSLFFEIIILLEQFFRRGPFSIYEHEQTSFFSFKNVVSLSILPSIIVSILLLAWLVKSSEKGTWPWKGFAIRGGLLGLCSGICMSSFAYILVLHNSSLERFLFLNITGLLAASFSGMLAGYLFSKLVVVQSVINRSRSKPQI